MFRPSDARRVQAAFDTALPAPYEAVVTVAPDRLTMSVVVTDPDDDALPVVQASWPYQTGKKDRLSKQPSDAEIALICTEFVGACVAYPAVKAANEAEQAQRLARQEANAKAREAEAERALKSAAAKVLAAPDVTPAMVEAIEQAASDPALR